MKTLLALALMTTAAAAQEFPVPMTQQDDQALTTICTLARRSDVTTNENAAAVVQYCMGLQARIKKAAADAAQKASTAQNEPAKEPAK